MNSGLFKKVLIFVVSVSLLALQSCSDSSSDTPDALEQLNKDIKTIDEYLAANGITDVIKDVDGVRMDIHSLGDGIPAVPKTTVSVSYKGYVLGEGTPFESGTAEGAVNKYIPGWQIALTQLPEGSQATIYIPSIWAYGGISRPNIPANSILMFDVLFQEATMSATEKTQFTTDTTAINDYMQSHNITNYVKDPSGIRYVITQASAETSPKPSHYDKVKTTQTVRTLSDDQAIIATFDRQPTDTFNGWTINNIRGVAQALLQMREGEKATVYIPSYYAFDTDGAKDEKGTVLVQPNTVVIVDVALTDVIE